MKIGLIYHTDYKGYEVQHTKKELHNACKVFDEVIVLSTDNLIHPIEYDDRLTRLIKILKNLKSETKVILSTSYLTTDFHSIPNLNLFQDRFPKLNFTGTYFNEESFFHPKFRQIWNNLNKIEGRKIWIPYTGSFWNEMFTLPQIALLYRKFDKIFVQPNYYQKRYDKQYWQMKNIARFIKNHSLGVEFEIDKQALDYDELIPMDHPYMRALDYFIWFNDIEDKAFYTGGLDIGKCPKCYQRMVNELE